MPDRGASSGLASWVCADLLGAGARWPLGLHVTKAALGVAALGAWGGGCLPNEWAPREGSSGPRKATVPLPPRGTTTSGSTQRDAQAQCWGAGA